MDTGPQINGTLFTTPEDVPTAKPRSRKSGLVALDSGEYMDQSTGVACNIDQSTGFACNIEQDDENRSITSEESLSPLSSTHDERLSPLSSTHDEEFCNRKVSFDATSVDYTTGNSRTIDEDTIHGSGTDYEFADDDNVSDYSYNEMSSLAAQIKKTSLDMVNKKRGEINPAFDSDTFLDNITLQVNNIIQTANNHEIIQNEKPVPVIIEPPLDESTSPEIEQNYTEDGVMQFKRKGQSITESEDSILTSALASKVRKDSIALTSDRLGDLQSLRMQYARMHGKRKPIWRRKRELFEKYQLHAGVLCLFIGLMICVSIGWHLKNQAHSEQAISQKIFFEAASRRIYLSDRRNWDKFQGKLGLRIPSWQLPSHCKDSDDRPDRTCLIWKKHAVLRISYFSENDIRCYNVSWESLDPRLLHEDCFELGTDVWYGPSCTSNVRWGLRNANFSNVPELGSLYGSGAFGSAVEYYWLSASSAAIVVSSDSPLVVEWNHAIERKLCLISNYSQSFYGHQKHLLPTLNYTICNGVHMVKTHRYIRQLLYPTPSKLPPLAMYEYPHWSTKGEARSIHIRKEHVISLAKRIKQENLTCGSIEVDGQWEKQYGDFSFDQDNFSNITEMTKVLSSTGCALSLQIVPYFDYKSTNFPEGVNKKFFVQNAGGEVVGMTNWEHGVGAMLDVSHPSAKQWITKKVMNLASDYQIDAFRLAYGGKMWLPYQPTFHKPGVNPNRLRKLFSEFASSFSDEIVVQSTSQSQQLANFISVQTTVITVSGTACLGNAIPTALTLGLMGYPFVISDGFVDGSGHDGSAVITPSRDLYIRWIQMSSFFPAMRYSLPPWAFDNDCATVARNYSRIHKTLVVPAMEELKAEILEGEPILRPLWWLDPNDHRTLYVEDEFIVGKSFLVAPILCESMSARDIYIPEGLWFDKLRNSFIRGGRWLRGYVASIYEIPHFELVKVNR